MKCIKVIAGQVLCMTMQFPHWHCCSKQLCFALQQECKVQTNIAFWECVCKTRQAMTARRVDGHTALKRHERVVSALNHIGGLLILHCCHAGGISFR
jgi:hypothetical protein